MNWSGYNVWDLRKKARLELQFTEMKHINKILIALNKIDLELWLAGLLGFICIIRKLLR